MFDKKPYLNDSLLQFKFFIDNRANRVDVKRISYGIKRKMEFKHKEETLEKFDTIS